MNKRKKKSREAPSTTKRKKRGVKRSRARARRKKKKSRKKLRKGSCVGRIERGPDHYGPSAAAAAAAGRLMATDETADFSVIVLQESHSVGECLCFIFL